MRFVSHVVLSVGVFALPMLLLHRRLDSTAWFAAAATVALLSSQPRVDLRASSSKRSRDHASAVLILIAMFLSFATSAVGHAIRGPGALSDSMLGVVIACGGLTLRIWAIRVLGAAFTSLVEIVPGHRLIRTGPYRFVRHPSYTGALLTVSGVAMVLGSSIGSVLVIALCVPAYLYRIRVEEAALIGAFGSDYVRFRQTTGALFPWWT